MLARVCNRPVWSLECVFAPGQELENKHGVPHMFEYPFKGEIRPFSTFIHVIPMA